MVSNYIADSQPVDYTIRIFPVLPIPENSVIFITFPTEVSLADNVK